MEDIDSTNLEVLGEIEAAGDETEENYKYQIGILGKNVLIRSHNLKSGNQFIPFLYERANHLEMIARIGDVFAGKLPELNFDYFTIKKASDHLVIGINETFPHTSVKPIVTFRLTNNRSETNIDGRERDVWNLYLSAETGKLLLAEMKRIESQVSKRN